MMVPPKEIESQLTRIWDDFQAQGASKMRASLFNFVIITPKDRRCDYMHAIATQIIKRFPSRILFIAIDEKAKGDKMETSVAAVTAQPGDNAVACDFITIELSQSTRHKATFLILPLLLADLPVNILWAGVPEPQDEVLQALLPIASRLIFDSEVSESLSAFAQRTKVLMQKRQVPFTDLNWGRTNPWRRLLALSFKDPERLPLLQEVREVHIHYNAKESAAFTHTHYQAHYLQGWLAACLSWEDPVFGDEGVAYQSPSGPVSVILEPLEEAAIPSGYLLGIALIGPRDAYCRLERDEHHYNLVHAGFATADHCAIPTQFLLDKHASGATVIQEVFCCDMSPHFKRTLEMFNATKTDR